MVKKNAENVEGPSNSEHDNSPQKENNANEEQEMVHVEDGQQKKRLDFSEASIRRAFVRKVFSLVLLMLLTVMLCALPSMIFNDVRRFFRKYYWIQYIANIVFIAMYITLICCKGVRRKFPGNIICLGVFTLASGVEMMVVAATTDHVAIGMALAITIVVSFSIIIFACQTKWDITKFGFIIFVASMVFFVFGILLMIVFAFEGFHRGVYLFYCFLGAMLMSVYLAYDTQMIMGGRRHEISPEEHIYAAVQLFVDIYMLFMYILQIVR